MKNLLLLCAVLLMSSCEKEEKVAPSSGGGGTTPPPTTYTLTVRSESAGPYWLSVWNDPSTVDFDRYMLGDTTFTLSVYSGEHWGFFQTQTTANVGLKLYIGSTLVKSQGAAAGNVNIVEYWVP